MLSSTYVVAYLLRFEGVLAPEFQMQIARSLPMILVVKLLCFAGFGLYRGLWRYIGFLDILAVFKSVTLGSVLSSVALLYLWRFEGFSRAVLIIDWLLSFMAVGGARVIERLLDEWVYRMTAHGTPTVIIGAGDTGARVLRSLQYETRPGRRVVGFLDDDTSKVGSRMYGTTVLGSRQQLGSILDSYKIHEVLIAISDPPGDLLQYVQRCCEPRGVAWRVVTAGITAPL